MTQAAHSVGQPYGTLGEVNARLKLLGFAQIGQSQAKTILEQVPRRRLVDALQKAHIDQGARRFLETLIPVSPAGGTSDQQASQPQPQPGQRSNASPQQARPTGQGHSQQGAGQQSHAPQPSRQANNGASRYPQRQQAPSSQQPAPQGANREREFMSHHVYGGKAALCWDVDETKNGDATIRLEAAKAIGERKYDWGNKITIQLTRDELPCVAAVFLGILPRTEGKNHGVGDQQGKGFEIEHQGNKLFIKVFAPQKPPCAVPVSPEDAFTVAGLLVRQIRKGKPWLSGNDIMAMLRAIIGRMKTQPGNH